jgi:hypothetical protein
VKDSHQLKQPEADRKGHDHANASDENPVLLCITFHFVPVLSRVDQVQ